MGGDPHDALLSVELGLALDGLPQLPPVSVTAVLFLTGEPQLPAVSCFFSVLGGDPHAGAVELGESHAVELFVFSGDPQLTELLGSLLEVLWGGDPQLLEVLFFTEAPQLLELFGSLLEVLGVLRGGDPQLPFDLASRGGEPHPVPLADKDDPQGL